MGATEPTHSAGAVVLLASVVAVTVTAVAAADARHLGTVAVPGQQRVAGPAVVHALLHGVAAGGV